MAHGLCFMSTSCPSQLSCLCAPYQTLHFYKRTLWTIITHLILNFFNNDNRHRFKNLLKDTSAVGTVAISVWGQAFHTKDGFPTAPSCLKLLLNGMYWMESLCLHLAKGKSKTAEHKIILRIILITVSVMSVFLESLCAIVFHFFPSFPLISFCSYCHSLSFN